MIVLAKTGEGPFRDVLAAALGAQYDQLRHGSAI